MRLFAVLVALLNPVPPQDEILHPWGADRQPGDQPKSHTASITEAKQVYTVTQGGTLDGRSCRTPLGVGMSREGFCEQTWESNRSVRLENVGQTDVVNPWLSNGQNLFRSIQEVAAGFTAPGMTDAEKATAIWAGWMRHQFHYGGGDARDEADVVKVMNIYGYNSCGHDSMALSALWKQVGLKPAPARGVGHCIPQVFYDGRWHLYDGDLHAMYLLRDNETVAGEQDLVLDHDLVKRTHTQGLLLPDVKPLQEHAASMYGFEGEVSGDRDSYKDGTMKMVLRPGEALIWRWGHLKPVKFYGGNPGQLYPESVANGLWEYRPPFAREIWRKGAVSVEGMKSGADGLAAEEGQTGSVVWAIRAPYVMVGGRLEAEGSGAEFSLSWDGKAWKPVTANFDTMFAWAPNVPGRHEYFLRCRLAGAARLRSLAIVTDLQMAPRALPEMGIGVNTFTYTDETPGPRAVKITHEWVERSSSRPPAAPSVVHPADGGESDGTDLVFRWKPPADPDGDAIADYQFELSNRKDLRWPLSMTFYKLISRTADKGKAQYTLPQAGLLTGDKTYYWRVRAKDARGAWGPWSPTWSFTARGPNPPVDLAVEHDAGKGAAVLRWKPNPSGRRPAGYRIYGSDERGFSVSDEPYPVVVGISKELTSPFPANFVAETRGAEFPLLGESAPPLRAHYRIVAVDAKGKRSGPSSPVTAPRPLIYTRPVRTAKVGAPYRAEIQANRSIGDLRLRQVSGRDTANFWDIERPKYALVKGPAWLTLDPATGVLAGTPAAAGTFEVEVSVTLEFEDRKLDGKVLAWGNEKVLSSGPGKRGPAVQSFTITVASSQ